MQLNLPPVNLLYYITRQNIAEPTFKLGLFLLVAPSNYNPPKTESNGAPISTTNVSAVLILTIPITKSFFYGKYCTGKRTNVAAFVLLAIVGKPAYNDTRPVELGINTTELYF